MEPIGPPHEKLDKDVAKERKAVKEGKFAGEPAVIINHLSKLYKTKGGEKVLLFAFTLFFSLQRDL